ncbi:uncharacterized protein LOC117109132 [Anneissia japonica]|uniref:uncharacterized protein LOC117109132 n=1 Tax=Anneissia japonica TaxID=1529436 RepID=UPI001425ACCC|nr:uncharacterized protein LOC117109132 [Anneissia japonica]
MMFEDNDEEEDVESEDDNNDMRRQHGLGQHKKMVYESEQEDDENYPDDEDVIVQYGSGKHAKNLPDRGAKRMRDTEDSDEDDEKDFNEMDVRELCVIRKLNDKFNKKFNMFASDHLISLIGLDDVRVIEILPLLDRILDFVLDSILVNVQPHDMVRFVIRANGLDVPISLPFMMRERITPEIIFAAISKVLQSHMNILVGDDLQFNILHIPMPIGGGNHFKKGLDKAVGGSRCLIRIKDENDENVCCSKAIVTGISMLEDKINNKSRWENIRQGRYYQEHEAEQLLLRAGVDKGVCGISELKRFQDVLPEYQIIVISRDNLHSVIFSGEHREKQIYLFHHDNNYDLITKLTAFFEVKFFCNLCFKGYNNKFYHNCKFVCELCLSHECIPSIDPSTVVKCNDCLRSFKNQKCFDNHRTAKQGRVTLCDSKKLCKTCNRYIKKGHKCSEYVCRVCMTTVETGHLCYMKKVVEKKTNKTNKVDKKTIEKYFFFDFECTQETGVHHPNLCVLQKSCLNCINNDKDSDQCEICGVKTKIFYGEDSCYQFCEYLFKQYPYNQNVTCIAHNFQGYDSYFIMQ